MGAECKYFGVAVCGMMQCEMGAMQDGETVLQISSTAGSMARTREPGFGRRTLTLCSFDLNSRPGSFQTCDLSSPRFHPVCGSQLQAVLTLEE